MGEHVLGRADPALMFSTPIEVWELIGILPLSGHPFADGSSRLGGVSCFVSMEVILGNPRIETGQDGSTVVFEDIRHFDEGDSVKPRWL
jgi:hypothetical protein